MEVVANCQKPPEVPDSHGLHLGTSSQLSTAFGTPSKVLAKE